MKHSHSYSVGPLDRYSAKKMAKPINFICYAPHARSVSLIGDFNDWDPGAHPMQRQPDITRARQVLQWQPRIELREGLVRTIAYFDRLLAERGGPPPSVNLPAPPA